MQEWILSDDFDAKQNRPPLTVFGMPSCQISDMDYMRRMAAFAHQGGMRLKIEECENHYRCDLYLRGTVIANHFMKDFCFLIENSNQFVLSAASADIQTIRATFLRQKKAE